ncbi:MAG: DNA polymerase III subunit delta [Candidatus Margulisiibacteriota bacterium]
MHSQKDNLYLLYGDEELLIREEIEALKTAHLGNGDPGMGFQVLEAGRIGEPGLLAELAGISMFSPKKMVLLRWHAGRKKTEGEDGGEADDDESAASKNDAAEELIKALSKLPQEVLFVCAAKNLDKRSRLYKFFAQKGKVLEFRRFREWEQAQLVSWVRERFKSEGLAAEKEAVEILAEISGPSLTQIDTEINKLAAYCAEKKLVSSEDVKELSTRGQLSAFALQNALQERDAAKALSALNVLLSSKTRHELIIGSVGAVFSMMLEAKTASGAFRSGARLNYYLERCEKGAKKYSFKELAHAVKVLRETDLLLKTSAPDARAALEMMLLEVTGKESARERR